ncbi:SRPBCC domain-containing protein [Pantoea sp. Al-1710]|uniref:SRPBCC domain-containing protein n=1 Tax=Candidatus Pantoea communis TaxID=2608354 RepID=A0ABX0RVJ7_9GAMM|nr:SRPBCC domain-containing protein [Pantoea communis]NIG21522.1 SRPBCC domain-containing protein [Pantoea communis]
MSEAEKSNELVQEYQLDAPPEKVWRAISITEYREAWLPNAVLAEAEPVACEPGKSIHYRLRDDAPPYLKSDVTFLIAPDDVGGTRLTIVHRIDELNLQAANDENGPLMLAA